MTQKTPAKTRSRILSLLLMGFTSPAMAATDTYSTGPGQGAPDTLCDVWQSIFNGWGLSPTGDEDNDGCSNLVESVAGTNPRQPGDCHRVGNTVISASDVVFTFDAEAGKQYRVLSDDSPGGAFTTVVTQKTPVNGQTTFVPSADNPNQTISVAKAAGTKKFYRLEVSDVDSDSDGVSDWAERETGTLPNQATSPGNASGGTATDGQVMASLLSLQATVVTEKGFERVDKTVPVPVASPAKIGLVRTVGTMALTLPVALSAGTTDPVKSNIILPGNSGADCAALTTVTIPSGQGITGSPYEMNVNPVQDAADEVPEYAKVTLGLPGIVGAVGPSATVCICESDPTNAGNQQLYIAYLGHEAGQATTASGYATALVNGDNTQAAVSVVFSNLSSEQNTAYIRYGQNNDLAPALPNGQVSGFAYNVAYKPGFLSSDQAFLTALGSSQLWCAVTSANFPDREIAGPFAKATGSTTFDPGNPSLIAPDTGTTAFQTTVNDEIERDIWRFMSQCTWGGTTAMYNQIRAKVDTRITALGGSPTAKQITDAYLQGLDDWLTDQMNPTLTPSINFRTLVMAADNEEFLLRGNKPSTYTSDPQINGARYTVSFDGAGNPTFGTTADNNTIGNNYPQSGPNRRREWWTIMLQCPDQVRQRFTQALSEIVIISEADQTVLDRHYGCANYWDMLAAGAFGKYREMLEQVTYSPMMGIYLSAMSNRATYDAGGGLIVSPDENYAREIMQLFSIGLVLRHPDGSLVLDGAGLPIPTYDQRDITELARVMTGLSHGARHAVGYQSTWSGTTLNFNPQSFNRVSDLVLFNGTPSVGGNVANTWFGRDDGHLYWAAPWIYPMKVIGRRNFWDLSLDPDAITTIYYHDFNQYVDPETSTPVAGVSKRLMAGKHGQYDIPMRGPMPALGTSDANDGVNDHLVHAMAEQDLEEAHNCLAGDSTQAAYGAGTQGSPGHTNTPVNISRWLIQRLVTSNPSAGYIFRVQKRYRDTNGNLGQVLKAIVLDYEARSLQLADSSISHGKVKEPLIAFAATLRAFRAFSGAPLSILKDNAPPFSATDSPLSGPYPAGEFAKFSTDNLNPPSLPAGWAPGPFRFRFNDLTGNIGQSPQRPPSVFNWFLPDYVLPGPMAEAGLFAPELQINTEANVVAKINFHYAYTWSNLTGMSTQPGADSNVSDFLLNNAFATPAVRFSLDGGQSFVSSLTFDAGNWNQPRTVTVVGANTQSLASVDNSTLRFSVTGAGSGFDGIPVTPLNIGLADNERPNEEIIAQHTSFSTWAQEGGAADTVTVRLSTPPPSGSTVTVNVAATAGRVTLSPAVLNFTSSNWNTDQSVTVTAPTDNTAEAQGTGNDTLTFTSDSTIGAWDNLTTTLAANVVEKSALTGDATGTYGIVIAETSGGTAVTEGTGSDTYTVKLSKQPPTGTGNNVTVSIAVTTGLYLGTTGTNTTQTLTFTNANYNTTQTVTVRANDDGNAEGSYPANPGHFGLITHSASGGGYSNVPGQTLVVPITDNDNRIILAHAGTNATETRVKEGGDVADQITVALRVAPTANVTVNLGSNSVACNPANLLFTPANFSTPQVVNVTAVDNSILQGLRPAWYAKGSNLGASANANLTAGAVSSFTIVNAGIGYVTPPTVTISPPSAGTTATATATINAYGCVTGFTITNGGSGYGTTAPTVTLSAPPVASGPTLLAVPASATTTINSGAVATLSITNPGSGFMTTPSVTFTAAPTGGTTATGFATLNSSGSIASITITNAGAGYVTAPTVSFSVVPNITLNTIIASATSENIADAGYNNYWNGVHSALHATILDNDFAAVLTTASGGNTTVAEGNGSDDVTIALTQEPASNVTVTLTPGAQVACSATTFTFTPANWSIGQTLTVTGVNDTTVEGDAMTSIGVLVSSSDPAYSGLKAKPIPVTVIDNDLVPLTIAHTNVFTGVAEGGTAGTGGNPNVSDTFTVQLPKVPTANVTVNLLYDASQITVSPATITFTPTANQGVSGTTAGYNVNQTITVTAVDDAVAESTPHNTAVRFAVSSTDPFYNNPAHLPVYVPIKDNDAPGYSIVESSGNTTPTEGGTDSYTVVLSKQPAAGQNVVINVSSGAAADLLVNSSAGFTGSATTSGSPNITTSNTAGLVPGMFISGTNITAGTTVVSITNSTSFVASRNSTGTGSGITITAASPLALSAVLTFTNANWNTAQTIVTTPVPDMVTEGREVVLISHTIDAALTTDDTFDAVAAQSVTCFIGDQHRRNESIVVIPSGGSIGSNETVISGGNTYVTEGDPATDSVDIYLSNAPQMPVIVALTANSQMGFDKNTLIFTPADWNVPQTVQVSALDDTFNDTYAIINGTLTQAAQSQTLTATAASGDPEFFGLTGTTAVNILDNESPAVKIVQTGGITTTTEGGTGGANQDTYTAVLTTPPNGDVVLAITSASTTAGQTVSPTSLTFTAANWNVPQTVTVTVANDTSVEGNHRSNITHTINQTTSTDTSGYRKVLTNGATTSGSTTVTVDSTAGLAAGMNIFGTGIPANATISAISALPNTTTLTLSAAATATGTGLTLTTTIAGIQTVVNNITDNDNRIIIGVTGTDTRVHEDGTVGDAYSVVLRSAPTGNVTITPSAVFNNGVSGNVATTFAAQGFSVTPATLTFTSANWNVPQSFSLAGADNAVNAERARTITINHTSASTDANYNAQSIHQVAVSLLAKDDLRTLLIDTPSGSENGNVASYRLALNRAPASDVSIALTANAQLQLAPPVPAGGTLTYTGNSTLTFTSANWNAFQTVTLRPVDDLTPELLYNTGSGFLHTGAVAHAVTSGDSAFNGIPAGAALMTITDNETPFIRVVPTGGSTLLTEAGPTDSYEVSLSTAPTADVTFSISVDSQLTADKASLTFTSADWSTPQVVTLTAVDDAAIEGTHLGAVVHSNATSADPVFSGMPVPGLSATITDSDGARLVVTESGGSTSVVEGGALDTIQLSLNQAPTGTVTVTLVPPMYIVPVPPYAKQWGYYTTDLTGSNQQRDRIVLDYTELILLYRTTFYGSLALAYGGSGNIPTLPSEVNLQNAHWAATKAIVDKCDLWFCGANMKAKNPVLLEPNQPPPVPLPGLNARQAILDCIYQINGGPNSLGTTRYEPEIVFDPKNPPNTTFANEIRDRCRWVGYLMSTVMNGYVSH